MPTYEQKVLLDRLARAKAKGDRAAIAIIESKLKAAGVEVK